MAEDRDAGPLVGSSEPLTPAQTRRRLEELRAWGVDLSLVQYNLGLTPTQRMEEAQRLWKAAAELRQAMRHAKDLAALPQLEATLPLRADQDAGHSSATP